MKAVKPLVLVLGIKVMEVRLVTKVGVRNDVNSGVNVTGDCLYNERVADAEVTTDITSYGLSHEFLDSKGRKLDITALGLDRELANVNVLNRWMDVKLKVLGRKDGDGRKTLRVGRKNKVDDMGRGFRRNNRESMRMFSRHHLDPVILLTGPSRLNKNVDSGVFRPLLSLRDDNVTFTLEIEIEVLAMAKFEGERCIGGENLGSIVVPDNVD